MGAAQLGKAKPTWAFNEEQDGGNAETVAYLQQLLASEASFQAAFEPTWRAAATGEDTADRPTFVATVGRICAHFDPASAPSIDAGDGPPLSRDEAGCLLWGALDALSSA